ncbi:MAG: rane-bound lytic murein transglycosylase [Sphingomonadales bacterium]|nr:rane-bound lytic murein transglycosylase [Sphingomonadales bacterium]
MTPPEGYRFRVAGKESSGSIAGRKPAGLGRFGLFSLLVLLAGCVQQAPHPAPTPPPQALPPPVPAPPPPQSLPQPPPPANAVSLGVAPGPALPPLDPAAAERAWSAFRTSCPALVRRQDSSGLTRPEDWRPLCDAERPADPASWFAGNFELVRVGDGAAFVTGYYEPQIAASRIPLPGYDVPIYGRPADLVEQDAATAAATATPRRGRLENGVIVPYYERAEIEDGALAGRGLEIAWARDPVELFFLEIQGSGRLLLPDGTIMRIGYAGQNGRDYVGIGRLMRDRGLLQPGEANMQGIVAWLHAHPDEGRALMRENKSYVFFREATGAGPLGALGVPVTPRGTVAADPKFVPLGAPVLLQLDRPEASGLWVAQDTGGAIKSANRFDTFWGAGEEAARIAGGMSGRGRAYILVPKGTLSRQNEAKPGAPAQF